MDDNNIAQETSYHVFVSHHGPDTAHTVKGFRAFLESKGLTCFADYRMTAGRDGVDLPPSIRQAIRNCQVLIVVLSKDFAKSSWCLEEAADIMELQLSDAGRTSVHVLPIFYGVEPYLMRYQLPDSPYDLSKLHPSRTDAQRSRWSQALKDLSQINGFDLSNTSANFEGNTTERILLRVEAFLSGRLQPCFAHFEWESMYSPQMEQAKKALFDTHVSDHDIVSIGILGLHRSEFAKVLFNEFRKDFRASCILLEVMKQAKSREGLLKLQSTLLSELANLPVNPPNIDIGLMLLLDRLRNIKCFIVIDDIDDNEEQLRSLLVLHKHRLGRGSRLVLTSRFLHVLHNRAQVDDTIRLWGRTEGEMQEESRKRLAICCESKDVHQGFIDHLSETFSMLGLCVSVVSGAGLLNVAREKQASMILVILSASFNVDSPDVLKMLDEASTCPGVKLEYLFYGQESGSMLMLQSETDNIACNSLLRQSLFKNAVKFSVNFERPDKLDMVSFNSLVNDIVRDHMHHEYKQSVTNFPVGLMKRQHKIENHILSSISERKKLNRIGILGIRGIGKTTIAKSLYNKIHRNFEGSAFLLNVRAEASRSGLGCLQKAIFDSVLGDADQQVNFSEGSALLSKRLRGTHTLVILDDVDDHLQLNALLFPLDLAPGSVVIITSPDRRILEAAGVDRNETYEIGPLDSEDARKLFYWHAFRMPFPPIGLRDIAHKVVDACEGLPISLQVIGAHVYNHVDRQIWEETLERLKAREIDFMKRALNPFPHF